MIDSLHNIVQARIKTKLREAVDDATDRMFADMGVIEAAVTEAMVKKAQAKLNKLMKGG
jgi:hypothetical protein